MLETGSGRHHRNRISSSISMHALDAHGNASQEVKRLREAVALVHPDGCSGDGGRGIAMHYPSHASGRRADQLRFSAPVQNVGCIPSGAPGGGGYFWILFGLRQWWGAWSLEILWALLLFLLQLFDRAKRIFQMSLRALSTMSLWCSHVLSFLELVAGCSRSLRKEFRSQTGKNYLSKLPEQISSKIQIFNHI